LIVPTGQIGPAGKLVTLVAPTDQIDPAVLSRQKMLKPKNPEVDKWMVIKTNDRVKEGTSNLCLITSCQNMLIKRPFWKIGHKRV
jgi:hypothetical protein